MQEQRARIRRLSIWFIVNATIFVACYLNYRLQLKHRYLYKTLNVGLCLSRAAAMVINFNLLLVWLPMCKYSLTRLAFLANNSLRYQRQRLLHHQKLLLAGSSASSPTVSHCQQGQCQQQQQQQRQQQQQQQQQGTNIGIDYSSGPGASRSRFSLLLAKINSAADRALWQLRLWFYSAQVNSISSFLIAVDHCTSLHTICATTITIASVIHTVAHLMNVINFSNNYDPLLSNLNMAEFRGQNPLQLLVSVPGITGSLMVIILILMSLSSVGFIRNSSYDLFQIFHRLSVIFVILLFLHPSSHVLKEQSNVDRHNPELCYNKMAATALNSTAVILIQESNVPAPIRTSSHAPSGRGATDRTIPKSFNEQNVNHQGQQSNLTTIQQQQHHRLELVNKNNYHHNTSHTSVTTTSDLDNIKKINQTTAATNTRLQQASVEPNLLADGNNSDTNSYYFHHHHSQLYYSNKTVRRRIEYENTANDRIGLENSTNSVGYSSSNSAKGSCPDLIPSFVAQSSICWYVLSVGLSCYLVDLILRKARRSKSSIQLLNSRLDCEGNLIELILSNNHKRFAHWLPGQFVYLNCPQIATFEWHPFTISSMDNRSGQFSLHIKTGGDWTRKLREKLEYMQSSISQANIQEQLHSLNQHHQLQKQATNRVNVETSELFVKSNILRLHVPFLQQLNYNHKQPGAQVECTKIICSNNESSPTSIQRQQYNDSGHCLKIDLSGGNSHQDLYSRCHKFAVDVNIAEGRRLELYIDGPFHSPFERLLEQQVSICIANGVGWTAFSSIFHCLTNSMMKAKGDLTARDCCSHRCNISVATDSLAIINPSSNHGNRTWTNFERHSDTKLHLMVIVTSIEQLKPFYEMALRYFTQLHEDFQIDAEHNLNPIKGVTAFLTRASEDNHDVEEFCRRENLSILFENHSITVNDQFVIQFGKPCFDIYLSTFGAMYPRSKKISVYCCGSYQVKKDVREICLNLNKTIRQKYDVGNDSLRPIYSYHEENF